MHHSLLSYKGSSISFYRYGQGAEHVICFHGYGEDGQGFSFLEELAGDRFSFYAIELPWHGRTDWNEVRPITAEDLRQIVEMILHSGVESFSLMGFSLGGRASLSLYADMDNRVKRMVLLAPDGLKVNAWYWLATQTRMGNAFFRYTMRNPHWFFRFLKLMNRAGFVNASVFKFASHYIGNSEVRQQLYDRWTGLRKLKPQLSVIKKQIRKNDTPVRLLYGRFDRIILASRGEKFMKGIESQCSITLLQAGHQVLDKKYATEIIEALTK